MKVRIPVALMCLLATMCSRESTPPAESTATTAAAARAGSPTKVTVIFRGLVVHVLDDVPGGSGLERTIVPRFTGHQMKLSLPGSTKTDVDRIFGPGTCVTRCEPKIDGVALRIVDQGGAVPGQFNPNGLFGAVTKLSAVPSTDKPFDTRNDLVADVFKTAPPWPAATSIVAGWLELTGGKCIEVTTFGCKAKFGATGTLMDFPSGVKIEFDKPNGATLQVLKFASGSTTWEDIPLPASAVTIAVLNDIESGPLGVSHFDLYSRLSKKRVGLAFVDLPDVVTDGSPCIAGSNSVPGCSNSTWP